MESRDTGDLLAKLSKRIRGDLALINGLGTYQEPESLSLHLRCITLGTEALFLDSSIDRINVTRHLSTIVAIVSELTGKESRFRGPDAVLFGDARRITLVGLALGDMIWRLGRVKVELDLKSEQQACCKLTQSENMNIKKAEIDFSQKIIESALRSRLIFGGNGCSFNFLL